MGMAKKMKEENKEQTYVGKLLDKNGIDYTLASNRFFPLRIDDNIQLCINLQKDSARLSLEFKIGTTQFKKKNFKPLFLTL